MTFGSYQFVILIYWRLFVSKVCSKLRQILSFGVFVF